MRHAREHWRVVVPTGELRIVTCDGLEFASRHVDFFGLVRTLSVESILNEVMSKRIEQTDVVAPVDVFIRRHLCVVSSSSRVVLD
jgi:hypothetical protein